MTAAEVRDWLATPRFDEATLKAKIATVLTERANQIANPAMIHRAQAQFARFGNESDYRVVPSNKQLQAVTPAQIKKSLAGMLAWKHRTTYFGPRAKDTAAVAVQNLRIPASVLCKEA